MADEMVDPAIADMLALPAPITVSEHKRKPHLTPEQREFTKAEVIARLKRGDYLADIYADLNTNYNQLYYWATYDAKFKEELVKAREDNSEILAERLLILDRTEYNPAMLKAKSENIKWVLGVRDRSKYGNKVEVTQNDTSALVDVLKMAVARIPRPADATNVRPVIEGELVSPCITDVLDITKDNS